MAGVRFTKGQRELITGLLEAVAAGEQPSTSEFTKKHHRLAQEALDRLLKSELVKKAKPAPGIGWYAAASAMRGVLGDSLAVPPNPAGEWCGRMSARIRDLGLTEDNCRHIARAAMENWSRAPYSFEWIIRKADELLATPLKGRANVPTVTTTRGMAAPVAAAED